MTIINLFDEPEDGNLHTVNQISEFLKLEGHQIGTVAPTLNPDTKRINRLVLHMVGGREFVIKCNDQGALEVTPGL